MRCLIPLAISLTWTLAAVGLRAEDSPPKTDQFDTPADREFARSAFIALCSNCHGIDARGVRGPDLTAWDQFRHGKTENEIYKNIRNGIPGTGMPASPFMTDDLAWQFVAFLRHRQVKGDPPPEGNVQAGAELFAKHHCVNCHWTGKEGGRRGPDLAESTAPYHVVRAAILQPDENISELHEKVAVVLVDGIIVTGMRVNENGQHLLLLDDQEQLRRINKSDVDEISRPAQSLMSSYKDAIATNELNDLIAFVYSLRKTR